MSTLLDDAFEILRLATELQKQGKDDVEAATKFYEACYLMKTELQRMPMTAGNEQTRKLIQEKICYYENIASDLLKNSGDADEIPIATAVPISPRSEWQNEPSVVPTAPAAPVSSPLLSNSKSTTTITETAGQANARLAHALDLDENRQDEAAMAKYMEAAELYLQAIKLSEQQGGLEESISSMLKRRLEGALGKFHHNISCLS